MNKPALILLLAFWATLAIAQTEKTNYKTIADSFETNYNTDSFEVIFESFSPEMQNALPLNKTKEFLTGLKQQAGKIIKREFITYEQSYASYKTTFERAIFTVNISIDEHAKVNGLFLKPFKANELPKPERNATKLLLPFKDEWTVVWGGDTKNLNYHVESEAQKNAFDFVITNKNGSSFKTNGKTNEDYYAFGKELIAPCDGEIVFVIDSVKDNSPGTLNPNEVLGNAVIIKTANNEYLVFAHFKQHSLRVKQGEQVKQGQLLGLCGNSGRSSEPHLHFHMQNVQDMSIATGIKCYFENILVNGQSKSNYSPIQKEKVKNN